jgi:hypothetical protein
MQRQTVQTATPRSLPERKAVLGRLVAEGQVSAAGAKSIDLREPTQRERSFAETLRPLAQRALARGTQHAA